MSQVSTNHNFIHHAPRKLRLISDMVRGLPVSPAVAELSTLSQGAATIVRKALLATIAAAKQQGLDESQLFVRTINVDEGPKLRRFIPQSKGRSQGILKRMSHLRITLSDEAVVIASSKVYKKELIGQPVNATTSNDQPIEKESVIEPPIKTATGVSDTIQKGSK